jgi:hypothetical protein
LVTSELTTPELVVPAPAVARGAGGRTGRAGAGLLLAGAVATGWNGVQWHGLQPGDLLLATALGLLLVAAMRAGRPLVLPWWLSVLALVACFVALAQVFVPVDLGYVAGRFVLVAYGGGGPDRPGDNLINLMHWEVALLALPLAAVLASALSGSGSVAFARRLATAWLLGCTISALVAISDDLGVTAISAHLLPFTDISGRQAGLTSQPNNVAVAAAMALPVAVYWATRPEDGPRVRLFGFGCGAVLLGGTFVAGSRGGAAAAVLALLVSLLVTPAGRRWMPRLVLAAMIGSPLLAFLAGRLGTSIQQSLRLGGGAASAASDSGRVMLARQALDDFSHRPFQGIGLWVITESHSIYLQLLASGGLVLLLAFGLFLVRAAWTGVLASRRHQDAFGLLLSIAMGIWALVGAVENQLTDRYLYLPAACLACLAVAASEESAAQAEVLRQSSLPTGTGYEPLEAALHVHDLRDRAQPESPSPAREPAERGSSSPDGGPRPGLVPGRRDGTSGSHEWTLLRGPFPTSVWANDEGSEPQRPPSNWPGDEVSAQERPKTSPEPTPESPDEGSASRDPARRPHDSPPPNEENPDQSGLVDVVPVEVVDVGVDGVTVADGVP